MSDQFSYKAVFNYYINFIQGMGAIAQQNELVVSEANESMYDPIVCDGLMKQLEELVQQIEHVSQIDDHGKPIHIKYLDLAALCNDKDLAQSIQGIFSFHKFITEYGQPWLDSHRNFADIVLGGAHNMAEARLLDVAANTLEPHEFINAVRDNASPKEIESRMENSKMNRLVQQVLVAHQHMRIAYNIEAQIRAEKAHQVKAVTTEREAIVAPLIEKDF